jgi:hypothetical protein
MIDKALVKSEQSVVSSSETAKPERGSDERGMRIRRLADEIYREKVLAARQMAPEEKLLAGEELFDYACSITLAGIRAENPGATDEECRKILEERLALRERLERQP